MSRKIWKRFNKRFRNRVEYGFMRLMAMLIWSGSLKSVLMGADFLGWVVFHVLRVRRDVTLSNLRMAFPEMSEKERIGIGCRTYQNFAKMVCDYIRFPVMSREDVLSLCEFKDKDKLDWLLENGKGGVMVAGHFGSWELMGAAIAQKGYPISFLVGQQRNSLVDDMMNRYRQLMGIDIIHMGMAVRGVIKALRKNGMVALLADQDARKEGVFIDFFGRPASAHQGPAVFALKTGAPILFGSAIRLPQGRMRIECDVMTFDHLKGLSDKNIREVTQAHMALLENMVRKYPDHWFWMHKRWKTRPPQAADQIEG